MIDKELLAILACPETHQPLAQAAAEVVEQVNAKISAGGQTNVAGNAVSEAVEGGLVREDGRIFYPIRHSIPVLLIEEGLVQEGMRQRAGDPPCGDHGVGVFGLVFSDHRDVRLSCIDRRRLHLARFGDFDRPHCEIRAGLGDF